MATQAIIWGKSGVAPSADPGSVGKPIGTQIFVNAEDMRTPEYTVYLHSISKRSHEQPHPIYRNVIVPACPKDKRYITFFRVKHPVQIPTIDPNDVSGPVKVVVENGKRAALCICNPSYVGTDLSVQDKPIPDWAQIASGECNLTRQGVFASMNEVPTEDELQKAEARRLAYYKQIFEEANGLLRSDPKKLQEVLNQDHHLAAEMFGQDVDWHKLSTPKVECPNCGEKIKEGIAFHYVAGQRCVLDWERAYLAGAVKKDEVPEHKRWWTTEKSREELRIEATAMGIEVDARWSAETLTAKIKEAQKVS